MTLKEWYPDKNDFERFGIYIKYICSFMWMKMKLDCYLYYGFDYIPSKAARDILMDKQIAGYEKKYNDDAYRHIFNSKTAFYHRFKKYMHRDIFFPTVQSEQEFLEFIKKHRKIVLKPDNSFGGKGFKVLQFEEDANCNNLDYIANEIYNNMKENNLLAEQYIVGHRKYREIYPESLNTVRINTLLDNNRNVIVFAAINQFGSAGSLTDNDEEYGIWAAVDIETGKVIFAEKDDETGVHYVTHPDTGKSIMDFENINWENVLRLAREAALVVPECRLIGWDIAVLDDGELELIEGNVTPELGVWQAMTHIGLKKLFFDNL